MNTNNLQLSQVVETGSYKKLLAEVRRIFLFHYSDKAYKKVQKAASLTKELFEGDFEGYKACNTEYHDLKHTMDALLASMRLIDGYNLEETPLPEPLALNLLIAALFHDTGYIQESGNDEGTGAKFTKNHVERSILFLENHHKQFGISRSSITVISQIIQCTGLSVDLESIPFAGREDRIAGYILGTADLLGQMSDRTYLEKLVFLYNEFREAGIMGFDTEFDILRKTLEFYKLTKNRFSSNLMNIFQYARHHFRERFQSDRNLYIEAIDRHMDYLKTILEDDTTNFRHKLKRMNLNEIKADLHH